VKSSRMRAAAERAAARAGEQVQSVDLKERLTPVVEQAAQAARDQAASAAVAARQAREKAGPAVDAAKEWAAPRIEKGLQAAGPKVEAAADRVAPAVDSARDRIVEDLLPRIVEAVNAATAAGLAAQRAAGEKVSTSVENAALQVAASTPTAKARREMRRRRFVLFGVLAAALAAGLAALKRSRGSQAPWESVPTESTSWTSSTPAATDVPLASSSGGAGSADTLVETVAVAEEPATADAGGEAFLAADDAASHTTDEIVLAPEPVEPVEIVDDVPAELADAEPVEAAVEPPAEKTTTTRRRRTTS